MIYFRNILLFSCLISSISIFSQVQTIVLDWTGVEQIRIGEDTYNVQTVKGFGLDNGLPFYALQQKHGNINQEIDII